MRTATENKCSKRSLRHLCFVLKTGDDVFFYISFLFFFFVLPQNLALLSDR